MCIVAGAVGAAAAGAVTSSVVSDVVGGGSGGNQQAQQAASAADPFASQRGQYQDMLSKLINDPSSITSTPGYQFGLDQSNKAVQGSAAANGMVNSGNVLQALSTNSQSYAASQLNNQELLLAQLSGANVGSPGTAGQILQGQNQTNQQNAGTLGSQIGGAVSQQVSNGGFSNAWNAFNAGSNSGSENFGSPSDLISGYTG